MTAIPATTEKAKVMPPTTDECSTNFYWTVGNEQIFNLQTTLRGQVDPEAVALHLRGVLDSLKALVNMGGHAKPVGQQSAPPTAAVPTSTAPAVATGAPVAAPASAPAPATQAAAGVLKLTTALLTVKPRPDGKADLEFSNPGRNYPEIKAVKTPEQAAAMLAATGAWLPDNFKAPATYQLPVNIEYRLSDKLNSKGNPFKDILRISPAA